MQNLKGGKEYYDQVKRVEMVKTANITSQLGVVFCKIHSLGEREPQIIELELFVRDFEFQFVVTGI